MSQKLSLFQVVMNLFTITDCASSIGLFRNINSLAPPKHTSSIPLHAPILQIDNASNCVSRFAKFIPYKETIQAKMTKFCVLKFFYSMQRFYKRHNSHSTLKLAKYFTKKTMHDAEINLRNQALFSPHNSQQNNTTKPIIIEKSVNITI